MLLSINRIRVWIELIHLRNNQIWLISPIYQSILNFLQHVSRLVNYFFLCGKNERFIKEEERIIQGYKKGFLPFLQNTNMVLLLSPVYLSISIQKSGIEIPFLHSPSPWGEDHEWLPSRSFALWSKAMMSVLHMHNKDAQLIKSTEVNDLIASPFHGYYVIEFWSSPRKCSSPTKSNWASQFTTMKGK